MVSLCFLLIQINARARYSLLFDGSRPELYLPQDKDSSLTADALPDNKTLMTSKHTQGKWTLYLPKAYHPLLLQQHRHDLRKAMKDVSNANAVSHAFNLVLSFCHLFARFCFTIIL